MKVDFNGVTTNFDGIPLGGFFMFDLSRGGSFGICVAAADNKRAVISLPTSSTPREQRLGWLQIGGLNQTFIHFPDAVLRPVLSSVAEVGSLVGSALMCAGRKRFIRGYENSPFQYRTFNIETGEAEELLVHDVVLFTRWGVGLLVDSKFEEIYSFPPVIEGQN